jgi:uncharacterized repeat protein (TIGR01451 family)/LPXTG-motif cell wall-anchored protein
MPGDTLTQTIVVKHGSDAKLVRIYLRAVAHDDSNPLETEVKETETEVTANEFLAQLRMTVKNGDEVIFEASPDQTDGLTENVLLGEFKKGESTTLTVTLEVPIELGNEYANRGGEVDWVFTADEIDADPAISVTKEITNESEDPNGYVEGEEIKYSMTVMNTGDVDLLDVTVKDELTGDEWTIERLAVGESVTYTASYTVAKSDVKEGTVSNTVVAKGKSELDGEVVEAEATVTADTYEPANTGDESNTLLWGIFAGGSLVVAVVLFILAKKRRNNG